MTARTDWEIGRLYPPLAQIASGAATRSGLHDAFLSMPMLRGYWPMSIIDESAAAIDLCGLGNLSPTGSPQYGWDDGVTYCELDGTNDFLSHADSALYDITGAEFQALTGQKGLTLGGWFKWLSDEQTTAMSKWTANNLSYNITRVSANDNAAFSISADGSTAETALSAVGSVPVGEWVFIAGRFTRNTEVAVFVNGVKASVASVSGSIFSGSAPFVAGALDGGATARMHGHISSCFLAAAAIPDAALLRLFEVTAPFFP